MSKVKNLLFKKKSSEAGASVGKEAAQTATEKKSEYSERKGEDSAQERMQNRIQILEQHRDKDEKTGRSRSFNPPPNPKVAAQKSYKIRRVPMFSNCDSVTSVDELKKKKPKKKKVKKTTIVEGEKFTVYDRYILKGNILGQGAYGAVCEAFDSETKKKVAIKKNKDIFAELEDAKRILREIKLMAHFDHPDIVRLIGVIAVDEEEIDTYNDAYLVMELMQVNLGKVIKKQRLDAIHYKFFLYQLLRGLKYIHSAGVIHRDLKPENILVNLDNCNLRITDFGLSRGVCQDEGNVNILTEYVVTRWYRAPEIICSKKRYDEAVDVWSVGCIFAEFFLRTTIFPGRSPLDQVKIIFRVLGTPKKDTLDWVKDPEAKKWIESRTSSKGTDFSKLFPKVDKDALDLLGKMLLIDPTKRIRVEDALEHPYLKEMHDPTPQRKAKMKKRGMEIGRETETTCPTFNISFEFERAINSKFGIRHMMFKELRQLDNKATRELKRMKRADKIAARNSRESKTSD